MIVCDCIHWARTESRIMTDHHPNCSKYNPESDAYKIIIHLLQGIETWANDEDGVHNQCWEAYKAAKAFVGQRI